MHYNTFPPIRQDAAAWLERLRGQGHSGTVLKPGESCDLRQTDAAAPSGSPSVE
ncbi:L-ascorbate metabolism protein UlaG (beta-lactamase superfamily) [Paenibacillus forsythiae]|uniref:L-ascorbate metabolism protein UlaG (Beta-lactamase superfamily) n=1 Tax=Paenibacillus forsythiae TaxID=365616 RepID=A0ABU3H8W7_9BACL|nr:hypothetical protein [Paenibacillus forsythiae]MDT3427273.1 L-ascorbate metabolism protein UlaG (beta-lactamase superfamily) [Paenibacillus forsythiae]